LHLGGIYMTSITKMHGTMNIKKPWTLKKHNPYPLWSPTV